MPRPSTPPATTSQAATEAPEEQTSPSPCGASVCPSVLRPARGPAVRLFFCQELVSVSSSPAATRASSRKSRSSSPPPPAPAPAAFLPSHLAELWREGAEEVRAPAREGRFPSGSLSVRCSRSVGGKWRLAEGAGSVAAAGEAGKTPPITQSGRSPEPEDTSLSSQ